MSEKLKPTNNKALFHTLGGVLNDLAQEKATASNAIAIAKISQCMQNCLVHEIKRFNAFRDAGKLNVSFREIEKEFD
jgi:hypothetical protein